MGNHEYHRSKARLARIYYGATDPNPKGGAVVHGVQVFDQSQTLHRPEAYS
jgi:tRNA(adenine34) deaminase